MTDLLLSIIAGLLTACGALAWRLHQQHQATTAERERGDENWLWSELHRTEADAVRQRMRHLEMRHANLQTIYAELVRACLAQHYPLIERNITWKRQRRR